ncbi:MAG: dienelactone hydrolase family protein [Gammaproteobacteria bacterium]|jgi:carboxymethylenebutenolidase|nr:dienelactone hydrolase family protein [Gammaproteobacteria bacterium]
MHCESIELQAADGHTLSAYVAHPDGTPLGGLLVLQEIFGVNAHIREVTENFAAAGYLAVAPAMFDRVAPGIELDYSDFTRARETMAQLNREQCVADMGAAAAYASQAGKVGIVGYCWGGAMADLAACHGLVQAGVSYYGRMTVEWLDLQPQCPMIYHYGEHDALIPLQLVEDIAARRSGKVYVWGGADHGFCCTERPQYHQTSAEKSQAITLDFLRAELAADAAHPEA